MNLFEAVKQNVTTRQAAELYGIRVGRNGIAVCPFHNDKKPSMKVNKSFHCFVCQADGDAVDFVSRLFGLLIKEVSGIEKSLEEYEKNKKSAERFITLIEKYENFDRLDITMLNESVDKILVHERDRKGSRERPMKCSMKSED